MRPVTDLAKLKSAFDYRLTRLRRLFQDALFRPDTPYSDACLAVAAIELDNLIIATIRSFTISALRNGRTNSGITITTNRVFTDIEGIAAYAMSVIRPKLYFRKGSPMTISRLDEVVVRDPRETEQILLSCGCSNVGSWQTALSLSSPVFSDLSTIGNFYAHRNENTWRKVRRKAQDLGLFHVNHPNSLMVSRVTGRPVLLFEDWLDDASLFFDVATM